MGQSSTGTEKLEILCNIYVDIPSQPILQCTVWNPSAHTPNFPTLQQRLLHCTRPEEELCHEVAKCTRDTAILLMPSIGRYDDDVLI